VSISAEQNRVDAPATGLPWVISADDHVVEPRGVWWDRLSARDREQGPHVVRDTCRTDVDELSNEVTYTKGGEGPETDWWVYEGLQKPIPMVAACAGFATEEYTREPISFEQMRPGCYDPAARLIDMNINHMERSLCFPLITRFAGQMFYEADNKKLAHRCVLAYNDWIIDEWCGDSGGRLLPLAIVQLWDPIAAADEVLRNAGRGCRAVTFTEMPSYLGLPSIHDPSRYWDPFFAACNETGTAICMHIGSGSRLIETSPYAPRLVDVTLTFSTAQLSMVEWLLSGLLERFPKLKIVYSESQIGWMPFILERIDKAAANSGSWAGGTGANLERPPSSYVPGRVFGCFFDDDTGLANREQIGVGQLLFEVDYPHQDTTWPNTSEIVKRIASQVPRSDLLRIVRENTIELLDLDPTSLVPTSDADRLPSEQTNPGENRFPLPNGPGGDRTHTESST
jgi:predicted TIM-barrel fold metal-dependent hydrolase